MSRAMELVDARIIALRQRMRDTYTTIREVKSDLAALEKLSEGLNEGLNQLAILRNDLRKLSDK